MKTTVKDVMDLMELIAPKSLAQKWDNVGLMLGNPEKSVKKIMVALDLSSRVAEEALEEKVDMIVTHHPVFFKPVTSLAEDNAKAAYICALIKNDIAVFSAHTNLDAAPGGVNDVLAEKLKLDEVEVLKCGDEDAAGLGRIGILKEPVITKNFAQKVKRALGADGVTYADAGQPCYKIAVIGGAGSDFIHEAIYAGADTLVTGDVKYHVAQDALNLGLNIIDAGHQFSESLIVKRLWEVFTEWSDDDKRNLEVVMASEEVVLSHI